MLKRLAAIGLIAAAIFATVSTAQAVQYGDQSSCNAGAKVSDLHRKIDLYSLCLRSAPMNGVAAAIVFSNRGVAYYQVGEVDKALEDFTSAIKFDPTEPTSYANRAALEWSKGRYGEAIPDLEHALRLRSSDYSLVNKLAWALATSPDPAARDGNKAIAVARQGLKLRDDFQIHDTLAAAYAEAGQFEDAQREEQRSLDLYKGSAQITAKLQGRLELYRKREAFHEAPLAKPASTR